MCALSPNDKLQLCWYDIKTVAWLSQFHQESPIAVSWNINTDCFFFFLTFQMWICIWLLMCEWTLAKKGKLLLYLASSKPTPCKTNKTATVRLGKLGVISWAQNKDLATPKHHHHDLLLSRALVPVVCAPVVKWGQWVLACVQTAGVLLTNILLDWVCDKLSSTPIIMEHPPRPWDVPRGERVIVLALEGQIMIMLSLKPNALSSGIIRQGIKDRTLLQVSS